MPLADDDLLRARVQEAPSGRFDVDADLAAVRTRATLSRRRHRLVAVVVAVVALMVAGGAGLLARTGDDGGRRTVVAEPTPTSTPSATATTRLPPDVATIPASAVDTFPVPEGSGATLALGGGSVWIGGLPSDAAPCHPKCGQITRLDPETGAVQATITVTKLARALVYGFDALWAEVEVPDDTAALVVKIDPATNLVVAQAEIPGIVVAGSTGHPRLAVGADGVWSLYGNRLTKFDPVSGAVVGDVQLANGGDGFVANEHGVWVVSPSVLAIDPATLEAHPIASLPLGFVQSAAVDGDTIWLTEGHNARAGGTGVAIELIEIDTATGQVTYTGIPTTNVAAGGGRVWFQGFAGAMLADTQPGDVVEIDPATARMVRAARLGFDALSPPVLAVDARAVWLLGQGELLRLRYP